MQDRPIQPLDSNAPQHIAGIFLVASTNQVQCDPALGGSQLTPECITPELLERMHELRQRKVGTLVPNQVALAILIRVGTLLDILIKK